jgi:monoterpene epsilon-lactone hydrolase
MLVTTLIILAVLVLWLAGWWFSHGEDLRIRDHPVENSGQERFSRPGGPSLGHSRAEDDIRAMGNQVSGMSQKQRLQYVREFMERIPEGREFDCEFRPVDVGGLAAEWVLAPGADPARRVLYIHGGAFIAGSPNSHRTITSRWSEVTGAAVLAIDYRLMPEHRRAAGIEDCRTAYRWILENGPDAATPPRRLYVSGDSAGGNLSLALAAWVRDVGLRAPDGVVALSPLTDSTHSAPSIRQNLKTDIMLGPLFGALMKIPRPILTWLFVLENRMRPVNPVVSPVFGDLSGLPPTLIQVSESEMLLDDARRYVNKARAAGSPVRLQTWAGLLHVWHIMNPEVPEALEAFEQIAAFVRSVEATGAEDPASARKAAGGASPS